MTGDLLVARLDRWSVERPGRKAMVYLGNGEDETDSLTFAELHTAALDVSARLSESHVSGRAVLVLARDPMKFAVAVLGCFYAGAVAVPCGSGPRNRILERLRSIAADCRPLAALVSNDSEEQAALRELSITTIEVEGMHKARDRTPVEGDPDAPALLQYTSGSTGSPKGVIVTARNLSANLKMLSNGFAVHQDSVFLCWLPLFHDMGLIAHLLTALHSGVPCILMQPLSFFQRPERWLKAISRFGATISGGPNFAFELLLRRHDRSRLLGCDLSRWEVAFCGAEVIRASTMRRFAESHAAFGLRAGALYPCYGLAEATVFVTGSEPGRELRTEQRDHHEFVSCGRAPEGTDLIIVDPDERTRLSDGEIGEIWVSGDHISPGYWNQPEESEPMFRARLRMGATTTYLRTGDLGWMSEGQLHFAGRLKDLIVWRGSNIHPEDIEASAAKLHAAFTAPSAAFGVDVGEHEAVVLMQEIARPSSSSFDPVTALAQLTRAVVQAHGIPLFDVVLVRPGTLPRTTSGKIQRGRCLDRYRSGLPAEMVIATLRSSRTRVAAD